MIIPADLFPREEEIKSEREQEIYLSNGIKEDKDEVDQIP